MKKVLILACAALTACTNDIDLGTNKEQVETLSNAIGFQMAKKNMTTTKATALQDAKHYNFGVWGYKNTDTDHAIMANYLVGYKDENGKNGYNMSTANQTTLGDADGVANGKSMWAYELMGSNQYSHVSNGSGEHYYLDTQNAYKSNLTEQFLRYWDLSSARTTFYAYAPYVNKTETSTEVTFNNGTTKTMTFPNGSIVMGKDKPADQEFMYAVTKVEKNDYKKDVKLEFHRMGARIQIKFWEDIPGYTVKMKNLSTNSVTSSSTLTEGIYAKPAIHVTGNRYDAGKYLTKTGADIVFNNDETIAAAPTPTVTFKGVTKIDSKCLTFVIPDEQLGESRNTAKHSATKYYMIPRGATFDPAIAATDALKKTGFIFHVSYELTNNQTNETIIVTDAKVFVPADQCNWLSNKSYTYVFKITKNSNGTTDKKDPDPENDLTVDTDKALYPIVFDGCTVVDYEEVEKPDASGSFEITDGTFNYYLNLSKTTVSKGAAEGDRTITVSNAHKVNSSSTSTDAADEEIKVYYNGTEAPTTSVAAVTYNSSTKTFSIKVETGAVVGEYSVMYSGVKVATFTVTI